MNDGRNDMLSMAVSDHDINAWIDGELVEPEHGQLTAAMAACPELASRVCALRNLKALLQLAYAPDALPQEASAASPGKTGSHD